MKNIIKLLSQKITNEYIISVETYLNYKDSIDIIIAAYDNAVNLFNPDSENSIIYRVLDFYTHNIDEAILLYTKEMDSLCAASSLMFSFINIQTLRSKENNSLYNKLTAELINNKDYYKFFSIDYFLELSRTNGIREALKELEEDVNIRANTYYNKAYKEYLELLPGLKDII